MSGFVLHPVAIVDLEEIWDFVAADSMDAAGHLLEEIRDAIQHLVSFPESGHSRPDLCSTPLKFQVVREFLIAYAPDEKPLLVIAVSTTGAIRA